MDFKYAYLIVALVRGIIVLLPQLGYIHPDEFFQSAEVVAGNVFGAKILLPWEFEGAQPIRTTAISYITCGIPFYFLKVMSWTPSPYLLLVAPRIIMMFASYWTDYAMWKMCNLLCMDSSTRIWVLSTSYVTLTYNSRASSNAIEAVLFITLLYYVVKSMVRLQEFAKTEIKTQAVSPTNMHPHASVLGVVVAIGIFNRPTFVIYAFAPLAFWLQFNGSAVVPFRQILQRMKRILPPFCFTMILFSLFDTCYYQGLTGFNSVGIDVLTKNLIWTPYNFIRYNVNPQNLAQHGVHPHFTHLLINVPLLFGYLGFTGIKKYFKLIKNLVTSRGKIHIEPIEGLMLASFVIPVLLFSVFKHQEPRFLIPILIPLTFLYAPNVWGGSWRSPSRILWYLFNIMLLLLYGFIHQGGVVPSLRHVTQIAPTFPNLHVIYFHTYMPPRHLVTVPLSSEVVVHDLGGADLAKLELALSELVTDACSGKSVLLVAPSTFQLPQRNFPFNIDLIQEFHPHLGTEDLDTFKVDFNDFSIDKVMPIMESLWRQMSLHMYRVTSLNHQYCTKPPIL